MANHALQPEDTCQFLSISITVQGKVKYTGEVIYNYDYVDDEEGERKKEVEERDIAHSKIEWFDSRSRHRRNTDENQKTDVEYVVCVSHDLSRNLSGMAIADITLLSGFESVTADLEKIQAPEGISVQIKGHIIIQARVCNTNDTAPEEELELDGDEILYIDFKNKEIILTLPDFADKLGHSEGWYEQAQGAHAICLNNLDVSVKAQKSPPEAIDPPESTVYAREEVELGKKNILICFVNNFYPAPVKMTWTKNNAEVKDGVTLSRYYPNRDFTYQQFSTLSITPEEGDVYSCTVEHKGLEDPLTKIWEPEVNTESDMGATVFCGIGLTLGLLGVGVGTFFLIKGNNCN
ncbi:H-2 class II histocompatibility antigen, A-U alpha chain-like [Conger conger]|uniref:H-2 class II histocompatibility antigen, A-U alpha chain-like n=1 Tax=Conger conger TaxID=82655 RepID=UPI002A5AB24C|nr:H-2 class II histocompatibility antigen, A-U alpha chain-like [Conger conger]